MITKKDSKSIYHVLNLLSVFEEHNYNIRMVGGCVRDRLLGLVPKDYDLATNAKPKEIIKILTARKIKFIKTGLDYGTITAVFDSGLVEITTLRKDIETYGRHAKVEFGHSFVEDAARRDFTINALSEDVNGKVYDYFNGEKHLREKKIIFVGEASKRIKEDYLRILRYFRFKSRFNLIGDNKTEEDIKKNRDGLKQISPERIIKELDLITSSQHNSSVLKLMHKLSLWPYLFPFIDESNLNSKKFFEKSFTFIEKINSFPSNIRLEILIATLLLLEEFFSTAEQNKNSKSEIDGVCKQVKLSNRSCKQLQTLLLEYGYLRIAYFDRANDLLFVEKIERCGENFFQDIALPFWTEFSKITQEKFVLNRLNEVFENEKSFRQLRLNTPPITAGFIIEKTKLKPGPKIGKIFKQLRIAYLNGKISTEEDGARYLEEMLKIAKNSFI